MKCPHGAGSRLTEDNLDEAILPLGLEAKQPPFTSAPGVWGSFPQVGGNACEVTEALLRGAPLGSK